MVATKPPIKIEIPASLSRKLEVKHLALYRILKAIIKATQTESIINGKFKNVDVHMVTKILKNTKHRNEEGKDGL